MDLDSDIRELKGIGDKNGALFHKLNIYTVNDLLMYFPRDYVRFPALSGLKDTSEGKYSAVKCVISTVVTLNHARNLKIIRFTATDKNGDNVNVTVFNMPYLKNSLKMGSEYVFYGKFYQKGLFFNVDQPRIYSPSKYSEISDKLIPVYPLTKGLSNDTMSKYTQMAFEKCGKRLNEVLSPELLKKRGLPDIITTVSDMHRPTSDNALYRAKKRIAYEEFLWYCFAIKQNSSEVLKKTEVNKYIPVADTKRLTEKLPFKLTKPQIETYKTIEKETCEGTVLNRLIQGDVGSGKTIVAILALLLCVCNGKQGAFMAPTEVLATQHFNKISEMTKEYGLPFKAALLTGSLSAKAKREVYESLLNGSVNLVIGTHALLEDPVKFKDLSMVVTDEQHRFGVEQRKKLTLKGEDVHTIVMSATPIPRSLAMILYGGMQVCVIDELPANRLPIKNALVDVNYRQSAYAFIKKEVEASHQAYVICPMIEPGVMEDLENVKDYGKMLSEKLGDKIRIAILHGKMKGKEKNEIMENFAAGNIDVLVSTTVIEVGIDVPNATVMMIENAERFGLAALHQIRGRVGRGKDQSFCIFVDTTRSEKTKKRLGVVANSNNGFEIAEADLKMRGPGEMSGTLQSGDSGFVFADLYEDADMLYIANEDAGALFADDPDLSKSENAALSKRYNEVQNAGYLRTI